MNNKFRVQCLAVTTIISILWILSSSTLAADGAINVVDFATSGSGTKSDVFIVPFDEVDAAAVDCKAVFIPAGVHVAIASPPFVMTNTLTLYGEGSTSVIYNTGTSSQIAIQTPDGLQEDFLAIRNLTIQGNPGSGTGLWINDSTRWTLDNVIIKNHGGDGVLIQDTTCIGESHNCFFINNGGDGVETLYAPGTGALGVDFLSCTASGNGGAGYNINSSGTIGGFGTRIIGGTVEQNSGKGIVITATGNITIESVYIEGNTTAGIDLTGMDNHEVATINNIGRASVTDILVGDAAVIIDGLQVYEDGRVIEIDSEGNYDITNFVLLPADPTDTCYISEVGSRNRGIRGLGNLLSFGNFAHWDAGTSTVPTDWSASGTASYASDTPPTLCTGKALKITAGGSDGGVIQYIANPVAGSHITISAWVKATSGDTAKIHVQDNGEGQARTLEVTNTSWKRYTFQHEISPGSTQFYIRLLGKTNTDIVYFAEVQASYHSDIKGWLCNVDNIDNNNVARNIGTLANDATPSVYNGEVWLTGGGTTITDFDDGVTGQVIMVIAEHSLIITDGANIFLNGSANFSMAATDTLTLICKSDNKWYEIGRSANVPPR